MKIAILGRQPSISLAELESLYGASKLIKLLNNVAMVDTTSDLPQEKLGGTIKSGEVITTLNYQNIDKAYEYIMNNIDSVINNYVPEGKIQLGVSIYGQRQSKRDILARNLSLKRSIRNLGRSVRIIENKSEELNTAQVLHNKLTSNKGLELLMIVSDIGITLARSTGVQDIDAYAERDYNRPKRDARVGMLPPKLAQIIINLAKSADTSAIMDPFCGTGVLLQEALLMGYKAYGSDIDPRMIEYSETNLAWLINQHSDSPQYRLEVGNATEHDWNKWLSQSNIDQLSIACETYLGKPLTSLPSRVVLDKIMQECDQLHYKFLLNISGQIQLGTRLCLAVPAWKTKNSFLHLKALDNLDKMGYNRISFAHARSGDLIYHRPDQVVARELVVLEKIRN